MINRSELLDEIDRLRNRCGDSSRVEVKSGFNGVPENIGSTLCAFANMPEGGMIIFGLNEKLGFKVTGISDVANFEASVVGTARNGVVPALTTDCATFEIEGKNVLVVEVFPLPLMNKPGRYGGRAYIRQSDGDYEMAPHEQRMIEIEKFLVERPVEYDARVIENSRVSDCSQELLRLFLRSVRQSKRLADLDDEAILRITNVIDYSEQNLTLTGVYALSNYPEAFDKGLSVTVAVTDPENPRKIRDLQTFGGPIPELLSQIMDWVRRNISYSREYLLDGNMIDRPEIPLNAVRELVANALVHRDLGPNTLGLGKTINIRLHPQKLIISNPGGLRGVSLSQLRSEVNNQAAANKSLYEVAKRLRTDDDFPIIEGEGGGIREVFRACSEYGLPEPVLINNGFSFTAIVFRPSSKSFVQSLSDDKHVVLSPNQKVILRYFEDAEYASVSELTGFSGLSVAQVRYALRKLVESKQLLMVGQKGSKNTIYVLPTHFSQVQRSLELS